MIPLPMSALISLPLALAAVIVFSKFNRTKSTRQKVFLFAQSWLIAMALSIAYNWFAGAFDHNH